jgi:ketosteroid isomerase-like protein
VNEIGYPVQRVLEGYKAAVFAKDVDAFIALYDQDVCVFDMWGEWSYDGVAPWRGMVTDWFGSLGTERVAVDFDNLQSFTTPDAAFANAFVTYTGVSAEGQKLRAMRNRISWALRHKGGEWMIIHENSSAPVDFATSKLAM